MPVAGKMPERRISMFGRPSKMFMFWIFWTGVAECDLYLHHDYLLTYLWN